MYRCESQCSSGLAACRVRGVMETGRRQKRQNSRQISIVSPHREMFSFATSAPIFAPLWRPANSASSSVERFATAPLVLSLASSCPPGSPGPHRVGKGLLLRARPWRALPGNAFSHRASAGQSVVRAWRASAAPGSQSVEILGSQAAAHSCASGCTRTESAPAQVIVQFHVGTCLMHAHRRLHRFAGFGPRSAG